MMVVKDPREKLDEDFREELNKSENVSREKSESKTYIFVKTPKDVEESENTYMIMRVDKKYIHTILVKDLHPDNERSLQDFRVFLITFVLFSILIPWTTVLLAYFTRPIGFGCRSRYISVLCTIWTVNSIIAYVSHIMGEKTVRSRWRILDLWFYFSGILVAILLLLLALLSHTRSWWIDLFGVTCSLTCPSI